MRSKLSQIEVVAPNLNRRLSGVTSTIVRLVPIQKQLINIVSFGVGLPDTLDRLSLINLLKMGWKSTYDQAPRVWHARRNLEMLLGLFLKHILRHDYKLVFTSASQRKHSQYTKWLINRMDEVIATSQATANYLEVPCTVVHHGINTHDFKPIAEKLPLKAELGLPDLNLIGCFGRIRSQKGTDVFVDALIRLLPDNPGWGGVILGRATEQHIGFQSSLKRKVEEAGLEDRILFPGEIPVDEISKWYQALNLFIAPQRWEGFGLTPLEAMSCGVPVIATRVGAFPELIIENETGQLIDPGDVQQMVDATQSLLHETEKLERMASRSRQHMVENFDILIEATRLVEIYKGQRPNR